MYLFLAILNKLQDFTLFVVPLFNHIKVSIIQHYFKITFVNPRTKVKVVEYFNLFICINLKYKHF